MDDLGALNRLRLMYEQSLGRGPSPTKECHTAGIVDELRLALDMHLSGIAGIASHGEKLRNIGPERRLEFIKIAELSFWDRFPRREIQNSVTLEQTPRLFHLMEDTEEARKLILACLE